MKYLTIINTLALIYLFAKLLISRIEIEFVRTFWLKKPYGIHAIIWDHPRNADVIANNGRTIFCFKFRREPEDRLDLLRQQEKATTLNNKKKLHKTT